MAPPLVYRVLTSTGGCVYRGGNREEASRVYGVVIRAAAETGEVSATLLLDSTVIERWAHSIGKKGWLDLLASWIRRIVGFFKTEGDKE
jgi:hypothetical protein